MKQKKKRSRSWKSGSSRSGNRSGKSQLLHQQLTGQIEVLKRADPGTGGSGSPLKKSEKSVMTSETFQKKKTEKKRKEQAFLA